MAGLFPNHVKEEDFHLEYKNSGIIFCKHLFDSSMDWDLEIAFR